MEKTQPDNTVMTLYPVIIPVATKNVITDPPAEPPTVTYGLPLKVFTELTRDEINAAGVQVVVDPPADVDQYGSIRLFVNGEQSGGAQTVVNERMVFPVFQRALHDGVINTIQYILKNVAGNDSKSIEAWALYNDTLPGGNDVPGTGDHPGLLISLPEGLGNPAVIDKDQAAKGVLLTFDYPHCRAYDEVKYEINRQTFKHTVTPEQAGKAFSVLIGPDTFQKIGSMNNCPFSYTVIDQLLNTTHRDRWSKYIHANIDLERNFLPQPILREDPDDDMDDPTIVDLDKLEGRPLLIVVAPTTPDFQKGDTVRGYSRLNDSAEKPTQPGVITDKFGTLLPCILELPNNQLTSGARLQVRYELERPAGTVIGHSRTAEAEIIGEAAPDLVAPIIKQAPGNSLDPLAAKDALTALAFDPSIQLDDIIVVTWTGAPGTPADGSYTSPPHVVKVLGTQEIALDNKVLAYSFGGNVTVKYSKTTGSAKRDSLPLILSVQDIADADPRLPTPTIDRVTGDELNPADLLPTDHTRTTAWPLIAVGQRVDLTYREIKSDGSAGIIEQAYKGKEVTTEDLGGLKHPVPVAKLASLADRSTLKLEVQVNFDGNESGRKVAFPTRAYNVSKGFDDLTTFTDYDWNNWELRHGGRPFIQFNDGEYFLVSAQDSNQYYSIQLSKSFNEIPGRQLFELSFNYRSIHNVSFEFSHNELNGPVVSLPRGSNWQYHKAIFSMPKPLRLLYLYAATTNGNFDIDNIRLRQVNN